MEAGLTRSCVLGVCTGPGWERTGRRKISPPPGYKGKQVWTLWFLEGTWLGKARDSGSRKHTSPLTSSVQEAEGRTSVLSSSPPLCALSIPAQSVLRGGAVAKLRIFSGSQERRRKMGWEREEADSQAAGEGRGRM